MRNKNSRKQKAEALKDCARIVKEWTPDVVHIHGTERFFGLLSARKLVAVPTVISIQGLMIPYAEWFHFFGNRSLFDVIKLHRFIEIPVMRGLLWNYHRFKKAAKREREILCENHHFMGRTLWDRAQLFSVNPEAKYFHVGEMIREPFWQSHWAISQCQLQRILFMNPGHPRKGVETLFNAADILRQDYSDLEVAVAGTISGRGGYGRHVMREMIKRKGYVRGLGALNAEQMAYELCRSHVFVSSSYIENSSNAVCEAQLVGVPVVSSFTGGLPSLVENRHTGIFFPPGDAPYLAATIKEIFENDGLAETLGQNAHKEASNRHDAKNIVKSLLSTYREVIDDFH
jgi:glycosyltransferase involved in cell wall biosynthesis